MSKFRVFLTDDEVARILRRSTRCIQMMVSGFVRGGDGKKTHSAFQRNLMDAEPEDYNGYRLWRVDKLAKAFGITVDEVRAAAEA